MKNKLISQIKFLLEGLNEREIKNLLLEIAENNEIKLTRENKEITDKELQLKIEKEVARQIGMYDLNSEVVHQAYILIWQMLESLDITLALKQVVRNKIDEKYMNKYLDWHRETENIIMES